MINMDSNSNQKFSLPKVQSSSFLRIYLISLNQYFLMIQKLFSILIQQAKKLKSCDIHYLSNIILLNDLF